MINIHENQLHDNIRMELASEISEHNYNITNVLYMQMRTGLAIVLVSVAA